MTDILIEGGRALLGGEILETSVQIAGGKIKPWNQAMGADRSVSMPATCWCCLESSICMAMRSSGK